ncbi:MAG TPA: tetratricopeptide repeat protein [Candidatus Acidoferrum sp.]|nr:tetratricopeptide repeat protein [Candidatus Acidoferrum sp.]
MRCKLSDVNESQANRKFLPLHLLRAFVAPLPILVISCCALTLWEPGARGQALRPEQANGSISGTVYLPGKSGLASQVAVSLKSREAGIFRSVLTDYNGHFEVFGLPRGRYEISVEEAGYEPLRDNAKLDGPALNLELHLIASVPKTPGNAYTVSVRELKIPPRAREEFNKGLNSLARNDWAGSLLHFAKAVHQFPGYYEAVYHQGVAETNLGQLEKALETFQKAIDLSDGRYARGDFGIGYVLYLQGKASEAETIIRRGLELDANSGDGYVILGMTLLQLNRPEEAEKSAREALLRNPNLANAYLVLADTFARRRNYREQIEGLDAYLKLAPPGPVSERAQEIRQVAMKFLAVSQPQN